MKNSNNTSPISALFSVYSVEITEGHGTKLDAYKISEPEEPGDKGFEPSGSGGCDAGFLSAAVARAETVKSCQHQDHGAPPRTPPGSRTLDPLLNPLFHPPEACLAGESALNTA